MDLSVAAFFGWLLLPQAAALAAGMGVWRILRRFTPDPLPAQLLAVVVAPVFALLSQPWFGDAAAAGARRCGAWGAMVFFAMLPVMCIELVLAAMVQAALAFLRE